MRKITVVVLLIISLVQNTAAQDKHAAKTRHSVPASVSHMKLYPTEADKYVNIYVDFDTPKEFTLTLLPTELSYEKKWDVAAKSSYQYSLDVTQLPPGSYTVVLTWAEGKQESSFTVKR